MSRNQWRSLMIGILADRTGHALELEAYSPGDGWTRYRLAELIEHGGLSTARYGNRWYTAAEIDAFLRGAVAATAPREETAGLY